MGKREGMKDEKRWSMVMGSDPIITVAGHIITTSLWIHRSVRAL
jgi:hypothetical protein